ncbi:MAG: hypothetical protein D6736_10780, partial [Nitrospinota bacterium]
MGERMSNDVLGKIKAQTAAEICQHWELEEGAKALLQDDLTPQQFLTLLIEHEQFLDATRFLAHALPKREAVWWACLCIRSVLEEDVPPEEIAALQAAERWVIDPSEEHRRAAMQAAEATEFNTPSSWAAMGAFWSGGSMAPPDVPAVPPGEYLTARAVSGA